MSDAPDQWYQSALEQKRRIEARIAFTLFVVKPIAILIGLALLFMIAVKL